MQANECSGAKFLRLAEMQGFELANYSTILA